MKWIITTAPRGFRIIDVGKDLLIYLSAYALAVWSFLFILKTSGKMVSYKRINEKQLQFCTDNELVSGEGKVPCFLVQIPDLMH